MKQPESPQKPAIASDCRHQLYAKLDPRSQSISLPKQYLSFHFTEWTEPEVTSVPMGVHAEQDKRLDVVFRENNL